MYGDVNYENTYNNYNADYENVIANANVVYECVSDDGFAEINAYSSVNNDNEILDEPEPDYISNMREKHNTIISEWNDKVEQLTDKAKQIADKVQQLTNEAKMVNKTLCKLIKERDNEKSALATKLNEEIMKYKSSKS